MYRQKPKVNYMRSYEDVFVNLKCVRCGSRERLSPYEISKVIDSEVISRQKRSTTYSNTISTVKLPICSNCNLEFQRWKKFDKKNKWSYRGALCYGIMAVLVTLLAFMTGPDASGISPLLYVIPVMAIPIGICLTHATIISRKSSKMDNNPKHSLKFMGKEVYVKPMDSLKWIPYSDWVNNTLKESVTEDLERDFKSLSVTTTTSDNKMYLEYCPKCNTKIEKHNKFCVECGEPIN